MSSCPFEEHLTAYLDQQLPDLKRRQVEVHLASCASCGETEALLRKTLVAVGSLPVQEPSPNLKRAVISQLPEAPDRVGLWAGLRRAWQAPAVGLAAAAAVAVVVTTRAGQAGRLESGPGAGDAGSFLVAQHLDVLDDYEVLGLDSTDDVDLILTLHEVEAPEVEAP